MVHYGSCFQTKFIWAADLIPVKCTFLNLAFADQTAPHDFAAYSIIEVTYGFDVKASMPTKAT
jgi:hypothetical protein